MSASSTPTLSPSVASPSARLTAVVDLPTPPLPEATAMIDSTPGTPTVASPRGAGRGPPAAPPAGAGRWGAFPPPPPPFRSAVSATIADVTPGIARTTSSACLRTDSQAFTSAASTVMEKNTLPSVASTSDSAPLLCSGDPSGQLTRAKLASTSSLVTAIERSSGKRLRHHTGHHRPVNGARGQRAHRVDANAARRNHFCY